MEPEVYKAMVQKHLSAFTPDDCLEILRDPDEWKFKENFLSLVFFELLFFIKVQI